MICAYLQSHLCNLNGINFVLFGPDFPSASAHFLFVRLLLAFSSVAIALRSSPTPAKSRKDIIPQQSSKRGERDIVYSCRFSVRI